MNILSNDQTTRSIQINTLLIMLLRGAGIACSLLIVPLTLKYLSPDSFGVWLTLTSIISWLSFMDAGLGNGMRNKVTEALTKSKLSLAREYVSTTYILFSILIFLVFLVFSFVNPFLNWNSILNTNIASFQLLSLAYVIVFSFCLRLILDLAGIIVIAVQKPYIKAIIDFASNAITLLVIYSLTFLKTKSLLLFGSVVSIIPVVIMVVFSIVLFRKKSQFVFLRPSFAFFKKNHITSLLNVGTQFFVIQIAAVVVFSTDNILITQLFSNKDVTSFNIVYKYFGVIGLLFSIILLPYWSSFTKAYSEKNVLWIKSTFRRLLLLWICQVFGCIVLVISAEFIYSLWIGKSIHIPLIINIWMAVYIAIVNWNNIFVYFLNGISKIRLQLYSSLIITLLNIPLSYFICKYTSLGVSGIIISNCICLGICSIWAPIQCYKLVNGTAKGIWNK